LRARLNEGAFLSCETINDKYQKPEFK